MDVLQFSISVFFFSNTLIQPKTANGVIRKAQSAHFDKIAGSMSDETAKQTFDKFLENNKIDGSIKDRSKIVRSLNRMDDPNKVFRNIGADPNAQSVKIGGRKGKTLIVNDQNGYGQRIKPNEFQPTAMSNAPVLTPAQQAKASNKLQKNVKKSIKKCFGDDKTPSDIELNGKKIFDNLDHVQKRNVDQTLGGTARHNSDITSTAHTIAERMGCKTCDEYLSIVEMVSKRVEGKTFFGICLHFLVQQFTI